MKKILMLLMLMVLPGFGQFRMKDSQSTVLYGSSGTLIVCVHDQYGNLSNDANIYAYVLPPSDYSGSHYHSGIGRPNIIFDGGGGSAGPKVGGCVNFHLTFPQYSGVYYVATYCTSCLNDATDTFYVKGPNTYAWTNYPTQGTLGIAGGSARYSYTEDSSHGDFKYGTLAAIAKIQNLGSYFYYNLGFPANSDHTKWLQMLRFSLPWGGWYDDIGWIYSYFWAPTSPDPHGNGNQVDFMYSNDPAVQRAFASAVISAGCTQELETGNAITSDGGVYVLPYWHVTCN